MLRIVSNPEELAKFQKQFINELGITGITRILCSISWRPASKFVEVAWLTNPGIWFYSEKIDNRWWNTFGHDHPVIDRNVRIDCEINIPIYGIERNIAGGFAKDGNNAFLIHRGNKYGGGKPGMTKALFWSKYKGPARYTDDDGQDNEVAIIGKLGEANFALNVANFVRWMAQLKGNI